MSIMNAVDPEAIEVKIDGLEPTVGDGYEIAQQRSPSELLSELSNDQRVADLIHDVYAARVADGQVEDTDISYELGDAKSMQAAMRAAFGFRKKGAERDQYDALPDKEHFTDRIDELARHYGFVGDTKPEVPDAEAAIVLGGMATSCWDRTRYAKELMQNGLLNTDSVVLLGSTRPATSKDHAAHPSFEGAEDEFDVLKRSAELEFGAEFVEEETLQGFDGSVATGFEQGWRIAHATTEEGKQIFVLSAPMLKNTFHGDGNRRKRANTADTLKMFAKVAGFEPGAHVVAVTNAHFKSFQGADAVGELEGQGISAEVVGYAPEHFDRPEKQPEELLQELFTTVNSCVKAEIQRQSMLITEREKVLAERNAYRDSSRFNNDDPTDNYSYNLAILQFNRRIEHLEAQIEAIDQLK